MLPYQVLETFPEAVRAGVGFDRIDRVIGWQDPPQFQKMGRSAVLELDEPLEIPTPTGTVAVPLLKIKGVGLCDHRRELQPPTVQHYHRIHPHLGFNSEGDFIAVKSRVAPLGGITLEMARAEFEISSRLVAHGCPSQVPLRLYLYENPDLVFQSDDGSEDQPLAAVVSGFPMRSGVRSDKIFDYPTLAEDGTEGEVRAELDRWAESLGVESEPHRALALLCAVGAGYTRSLRKFHEAGFYRYSGMADNYAYSVSTRQVFLIDLDSSRPIAECSKIEAPLQILRDVASALYGMTAHMLRRRHLDRYKPDEIRRIRFYPELVGSYFQDAPWAAVEETAELLEWHYERIWAKAEVLHDKTPDREVLGSDELSYVDFRKSRRQQYWLDRKETYCFFVTVLRELYDQSAWRASRPQQLSRDEMHRRIAAYVTPEAASYIQRASSPVPAMAV